MNNPKYYKLITISEIILIAIGTLFFCWNFLDFDPRALIGGGEYFLLNQTHFIWELLPKCGDCVFWNGLYNGGAPTFAEIHNAPLHPFVAIPAIFMGVINGSKVTLLLSFFIAGIGQWRLSKFLGLSRITRIWTAYAIMFGGQLSGKMELGNTGLILSTACSILLFSELYRFAFVKHEKFSSVQFAVYFSLCLLSGQGYLQFAVIIIWIPLAFLFRYKKFGQSSLPLILESIGLSFLLSGFFLIPLLHFLPNLAKDGDMALGSIQPLGYSVLNLVINDPNFFHSLVLGQNGAWYSYNTYLGWIPVLLAFFGVYKVLHQAERKSEVVWLLFSILGIYLFCSQELLSFIGRFYEPIYKLRTISVVTGLVSAPIIALAGLGLDQIRALQTGYFSWKNKDDTKMIQLSPTLILVYALVILSLSDLSRANRGFLFTYKNYPPEEAIQKMMLSYEPRWIEPMNFSFYPFFIHNHNKLSIVFRPWQWINHPNPEPAVRMIHHPTDPDPLADIRVGEIDYYIDETSVYAGLFIGSQFVDKCNADTFGGGEIEVTCSDAKTPISKLIIQENYYTGWHAWMDGKRVALDTTTNYLTVNDIPAGDHTFLFKYQPWDVWVGISLTLFGILFSLYRVGLYPKRLNAMFVSLEI